MVNFILALLLEYYISVTVQHVDKQTKYVLIRAVNSFRFTLHLIFEVLTK